MSDVNEQRAKHQAFYQSTAWRKLRLVKLNSNPLCEICLASGFTTVATEVNHRVALQDDYSKRLEYRNLQSTCKPCHSRFTIIENVLRKNRDRAERIETNMNDLSDYK